VLNELSNCALVCDYGRTQYHINRRKDLDSKFLAHCVRYLVV